MALICPYSIRLFIRSIESPATLPVTLTMKKAEGTSVSWDTALRGWLKEKVFWTGHVDGELELVENDPRSRMRVILRGVPEHRVVVLPEEVDHVRGLKDEKGVKRKCDYAVFAEVKGGHRLCSSS